MDSGKRRNIPWITGVYQRPALEPALFCNSPRTSLGGLRAQCEPKGIEVVAYVDDVSLAMLELNEQAVQGVTFLRGELAVMGGGTNDAEAVALPPPSHVATEAEFSLLAGVGVGVAEVGGRG